MRKWVPVALLVSATVAACGGRLETPPAPSTTPTTPVTFSVTVTTPTSTIPEPTATSYIGPQGLPIETGPFLAPATTTRLGAIVNGIQCVSIAQMAYTAYAHLQVYVGGHSRALPGGIGLVGPVAQVTPQGLLFSPRTCMYWLHTRAADGLIQVQSPVPRRYTLGEFFRIWNQPLSSEPGRTRARARDRDRQRQALARRSGQDPAARAHRDSARGRSAGARDGAGRLGRDRL